MQRVTLRILASALVLGSSLAQAAVTNQVQADLGVISPLPYTNHFGDTFIANGQGYLTTANAGGIVRQGSIDGSVLSRPLVSQPGNANFNFYDDYLFTMPGTGGSLNASAVSLSFTDLLGVNNLQARLYAVGADGLSTGGATGAVYAWVSATSTAGGTLNLTTFGAPVDLLAGVTYALEIRGLATGPTASYGGSLVVTAVPEANGLALSLAGIVGLGLVGGTVRRSRQA